MLSPLQIEFTKQLLISVVKKEPSVYYYELCNRANTKMLSKNIGKELGAISSLCHRLGLPLLSAKVISVGEEKPGKGFYELCLLLGIDTLGLTAEELYKAERKKIRGCTEWFRLADYLNLHIDGLNRTTPEIRILPMNKTLEFDNRSIEQMQLEYFQHTLPNRLNCEYYYHEASIKSVPGSLVLFQYDGAIIASAIFDHVDEYPQQMKRGYNGAICFIRDSIRVFRPILYEELHRIDSTVVRFSRVKQRLNLECLTQILDLIARKSVPLIPDEVSLEEQLTLKEGAAKQILVNAYERNHIARHQCIEHYGSSCVVCGFNSGKVYGPEYEGMIHVHHLKQLSEIKEEYEVDAIEDLRPVCPNCHMVIHQKNPPLSITDIKRVLDPDCSI